jgi:hypothetical protein
LRLVPVTNLYCNKRTIIKASIGKGGFFSIYC